MRRKDTTQDDLRGHVAAALLRMLEGRELSQVAVKELAAEAGVSRSTFYRLFEGKDQVVSWWYGTLMDGYVRLFAEREDPIVSSQFLSQKFLFVYFRCCFKG